jgi:hypothetical protein
MMNVSQVKGKLSSPLDSTLVTDTGAPIDDRSKVEKEEEENDEELYSLKNFSI